MADEPSAQEKDAAKAQASAGAQTATQEVPKGTDKPVAAGAAAAEARAAKPVKGTAARRAFHIDEGPQVGWFGRLIRQVARQTPSWLVSMVVHVVVLLLLGLVTLPPPTLDVPRQLVVAPGLDEQLEEIESFDAEPPVIDLEISSDVVFESEAVPEQIDPTPFDDLEAAAATYKLEDFGIPTAPQADLLNQVGSFSASALDGRGAGKGRWGAKGGWSEGSERAVALALKWLAAHQLTDGGWSFDHTAAPRCRSQCRNPGQFAQARNAATGLALLPFLGAGQTHKTGEYREQVKRGLYFLVNNMHVSAQGGSLYEPQGRMYSHGICSIALCEAYAMTHDKGLYAPAQQSLNFIAYAQDPIGGGWRYAPRQRGDTSVVGWQIMALKSGHMAYLRVPPITVKKVSMYLDAVQANNGANYGYVDPGTGPATTAIGLLSRMYLGWKHDNPALQRGAEWIGRQGPSQNMYYNYYATQVMRHMEGELWEKWNSVMRDQLVDSQAHNGHEQGSWYFTADNHARKGGRLYCTSMATMVLEVYYRHLPIYRKQSTEEHFPLD